MSKKKIWVLAISMTVGLLGLIFIQGYWIKVAIRLKEQQFSYFVNQSLTVLTNELEQREALNYVVNELASAENDSMQTGYQQNFSSQTAVEVQSHNKDQLSTDIKIQTNTSFYQQKIFNSEASQENGLSLKDSHKLNVINQDPLKSIPSKIKDFNDYFKQKVDNKSLIINKVMNKMIEKKPEIEDRIDYNLIDNLLKKEFKKRGVNIDYQFAVSKIGADPIIKTDGFKVNTKSNVYMRMLFPNDLYSPRTYLTLYFPKERKLFYKSLGIMGVSSVFFTLFLIMTFIITLLIIFRQKKLAQIKTDFVNNMTHEFKTPISTISLASEMIKEKGIGIARNKLKHISDVIEEESKRLGRQVEKVLQIAIFDKGKIKFKREKVNTHSLLSDIASNYEMQVKNKNGKIISDFNAKNHVITADEVHFSNILSNLVDNAIKYSNSEPEIKLSTWNSRKKLFIAVKDNGIGIAKKEQKKIFEKFYRISTGNIHNIKGFGLGLSYVKTIVEELGGTINIESQPGKGTRFILSFPNNNNKYNHGKDQNITG